MDMRQNTQLFQILRTVAPGTSLRSALDQIIQSKNGALIVLSDGLEVMKIAHGGFELDTEFSPIKLYELAKMDGAIIVSADLSHIVRANVHLVPDLSMPSTETGMRLRTSERTARQLGVPVVSISEELGSIFLYVGDVKYILEDIRFLLAKASQALQALEKYKARLDQVLANLNDLEIEDVVTLEDVGAAVSRFELVERVSGEIEQFIVELGDEGRLIEMQIDELIGNVRSEYTKLLKDYARPKKKQSLADVMARLSQLHQDDLLDPLIIIRTLGYAADPLRSVTPKGYRLLSHIPKLPAQIIDRLITHFGSLNRIVKASSVDFADIEGLGDARVRLLWEGLRRLSETSLAEKYI